MGRSEMLSFQTSETYELLKREGEDRARHLMNVGVGVGVRAVLREGGREESWTKRRYFFQSLPPSLSRITYLSSAPSALLVRCQEGGYRWRLCGAEREHDHDPASCPLLFSRSHFLLVAENSAVPLAYLSKEQCPAQLRGQWDRSERS